MDTYLQIAQEVLRLARRPLSPKAILTEGFVLEIVPPHLHGKTQHKTLQARISEDILTRRDRSPFFRTEPGKFFLREFITDTSLPLEFREPFISKRRTRELPTSHALSFSLSDLAEIGEPATRISKSAILSLAQRGRHTYVDPSAVDTDIAVLIAFVMVGRGEDVLSYRIGRYREHRASFLFKRTVGFTTYIDREDANLFSEGDWGIVEGGVTAARIDLDIPAVPAFPEHSTGGAWLSHFVLSHHAKAASQLIAVINFECPAWFEPMRRRLAINDLRWFPRNTRINQWEDFDPWSRSVLQVEQNSDIA